MRHLDAATRKPLANYHVFKVQLFPHTTICVLILLNMCPHTAICPAKEQDEAAACRKPLAAYHICEVQLILRDFASVCERLSPLPLPLSPLPLHSSLSLPLPPSLPPSLPPLPSSLSCPPPPTPSLIIYNK